MDEVKAPMPGTINEILIAEGETVKEGQEVAVLQSMKMNNPICAPCSGTVKAVKISVGDHVKEDSVLIVIE